MNLSPRAEAFLRNMERDFVPLTEEQIRTAFVANDAPAFQPLIDFERSYGGYRDHIGMEPVTFRLLKGLGGLPIRPETSIIEFEHRQDAKPSYYFNCTLSDVPIEFCLDEEGIVYEDGRPVAASFEKFIEQRAIWHLLYENGFERYVEECRMPVEYLAEALGLTLVPEPSDRFTQWWSNGEIYLRRYHDFATILSSRPSRELARLMAFLQK